MMGCRGCSSLGAFAVTPLASGNAGFAASALRRGREPTIACGFKQAAQSILSQYELPA